VGESNGEAAISVLNSSAPRCGCDTSAIVRALSGHCVTISYWTCGAPKSCALPVLREGVSGR
jgi:hypothetical protein